MSSIEVLCPIYNKTVNATAAISSNSIDLSALDLETMAISCKIESGSAPDVKVTYTMSNDNSNFIVPDGDLSLFDSITSGEKGISFTPTKMRYVIFTVTGNASNDTDTKVTLRLSASS